MNAFTTAAGAAVDVDFRTWATFAVIVLALALYATERLSIEVTSIGVICFLLIFFQFFPEVGPDGANRLDAIHLIDGFSNPALITVLALLVIGHGMVRTGALEYGARLISRVGRGRYWPSVTVVLVTVVVVSAFLNNIPVVVIFIPILQMLSERMGHPAGKIMMGLSFVAVLGGSTTLIGSGSNLLVSGALRQAGEVPFGFFDFTVPGLVLAAVGLAYVLLVAPRLLPDRESLASRIMARGHKYFLAQIAVDEKSPLVGMQAVGGVLSGLKDARLRMIIRGDRALRPPYHHLVVEAGDVVVLAASRDALARAEAIKPGMLETGATDGVELETETERMLAEVMVVPASSLRGQFIGRAGFQRRTRCIVLGIQRRAHMFRSQIGHIPLREGDVLLMQGHPDDIAALRNERDVVVLEGSSEELPALHHAASAGTIFLAVVAAAATGTLPIVGAALTGAVAMVATGVLNVAQAARALDSRILTMIPATLAMGLALQETDGAAFLAHGLISLVQGAGPAVVLSGFFLIAAALANVISSNACAVLFTPIAVGLAREIGVDAHVFATAVVLAANCAFATPIGYQTNLLVMGPGHYRFGDFPKVGMPLVVILWGVFSLFAPLYWDL
ncbi:MAG: SLC13 family permease [Hyphomicrobiales bacterium]|nr:SLC13 family permease [Hyphomicrobiales bacterium]